MPPKKDPVAVSKGRIGSAMLHARYDGRSITSAARAAAAGRFLVQARADAEQRGEHLTDAELERRAGFLAKAHMARMRHAALLARARSKKKKAADDTDRSPAQISPPSDGRAEVEEVEREEA